MRPDDLQPDSQPWSWQRKLAIGLVLLVGLVAVAVSLFPCQILTEWSLCF